MIKILIIEDNLDLSGILSDYFESQNVILDFADNGELGLALALEHNFDAIILDVMLPKLDGFTLCRKLRQQSCNTPVLMLTALNDKNDLLTGFDCGADDFLGKPFDLEVLDARLQAMVKRYRGTITQNILRFGELELNTAQHQAQRLTQPLVLTPTNFQILQILMHHAPNIVKRELLIEAIWGQDPPGNDILRSHMYQLRNQLDKPFKYPMLVTIPKVGFRLQLKGESN